MNSEAELAERVRKELAGRPDFAEKRMMGGLVFMVHGHMCCGVSRGSLMVRVGRDAYGEALARPHVRAMRLGTRNPIGYVQVDPAGLAQEESLREWIQRGLRCVAQLLAAQSAKVKPRASRTSKRKR